MEATFYAQNRGVARSAHGERDAGLVPDGERPGPLKCSEAHALKMQPDTLTGSIVLSGDCWLTPTTRWRT